MEVVHAGVAIDTAPHPTRPSLRLELGDALVLVHAACQVAAATSEVLHRLLSGVRGEIDGCVTE